MDCRPCPARERPARRKAHPHACPPHLPPLRNHVRLRQGLRKVRAQALQEVPPLPQEEKPRREGSGPGQGGCCKGLAQEEARADRPHQGWQGVGLPACEAACAPQLPQVPGPVHPSHRHHLRVLPSHPVHQMPARASQAQQVAKWISGRRRV